MRKTEWYVPLPYRPWRAANDACDFADRERLAQGLRESKGIGILRVQAMLRAALRAWLPEEFGSER